MELPKKPKAVFHHPIGFALYDGMAMDLHAVAHAEGLARENDRLRHECEVLSYWGPRWETEHAENEKLRTLIADIKAWDVAQYLTLPLELRERIQAVMTPSV